MFNIFAKHLIYLQKCKIYLSIFFYFSYFQILQINKQVILCPLISMLHLYSSILFSSPSFCRSPLGLLLKFILDFIIYTLEYMEATAAYQRLKQIFPNHIENINIYQITPKDVESLIPKNLPHLSLDRIHRLCRSQQKNVMNKVLQIKQMDLYDEMANVCPNKDLKLMRTFSNQQVNQKIHDYSTQMMQSQKDQHSSTEQSQSQIINLNQQMDIQDEPEGGERFNNVLRNIFQQYDNNFQWNQINIYDMH